MDYTEGLAINSSIQRRLNQRQLKIDLSEYIQMQSGLKGTLSDKQYFRCKYLDEKTGQMLMLFLYRDKKLRTMQYWLLSGICLAHDWNEDSEDKGLIRLWLKTKIEDMPESLDEVIALRVKEIIANTSKTKWQNVLKEVVDAFDCERDKGYAEKLAFLQKLHFAQ